MPSSAELRSIEGTPDDVGTAIHLSDISKAYKVYDKPLSFMRELLTGKAAHSEKRVLQDISLDIKCGEVVGIIGRNGAGKSTLLKIIAGTLAATTGKVEVRGRVSAILELGTGFNPAYSGRDNVILSALMRGMSEGDVRRKFDGIVAFAGLEDVIDEPFHTYSSGMQARLAFAAAVSVEADVIIIDEALAAGDIRFTARSIRRVREICHSGVTALFVSHNTYHVMQMCTRAIWIDEGRVRMDGDPIEVVRTYEYEMHDAIARDQGETRSKEAPTREADTPPRPLNNQRGNVTDAQGATSAASTSPPSGPPSIGLSSPVRDRSEPGSVIPSAALEQVAEGQTGSVTDLPLPQGAESAAPTCARSGASSISPLPDQSEAGPVIPSEPGPVISSQAKREEMVGYPSQESGLSAQAGEHVHVLPNARNERPRHFETDKYRISHIEMLDGGGCDTRVFKFGEPFRLRVGYECLMPELPESSCGVAAAFTRVDDLEPIMYFNTNYPHSDREMQTYDKHEFRRYRGRQGVIEAAIDFLQVKPGDYYVTVGILPNEPSHHEFYELRYLHYTISVLPNGFPEPSAFYPIVAWTNRPA